MKRQIALDCAVLCALAVLLIWPLFRAENLDQWTSIDGGTVTNIRAIVEHGPHPKWQPLWFCGVRFAYLQPPATGYISAWIARTGGVSPVRAFHIFIASMLTIGVAGVYFLVRVASGRRGIAWLAAAITALTSPVYMLFPGYLDDALQGMPMRLNYAMKWGDAPHIASLAVIPFALGCLWIALSGGPGGPPRTRGSAPLVTCGVLSALVISCSLYGGIALFVMSAMAAWAIALEQGGRGILARCALVIAITYALCSWWLTPSFMALVTRNLSLVTPRGNGWSRGIGVMIVIACMALVWRRAGRFAGRAWPIFLAIATAGFALEIIGWKWFRFRMGGEPVHFFPEFDLMLILVLAECAQLLRRMPRRFAIGTTAIVLYMLPAYAWKPWSAIVREPKLDQRVERRLPEWIAQNLPGARVFANGSVRTWLDAWRDIPQISGAADQSVPNRLRALEPFQINAGEDVERDIAWLVATGADALVTHDATSKEPVHAMRFPRKFIGRLPVLYDRDGDIVYRVPRRFPGLGRIVEESRMRTLPQIPLTNFNRAELQAYAAAIESSPVQVEYTRVSPEEIRIRARTAAGESLLILETFDSSWRAYEGAAQLPIRTDVLGFMRVEPSPGDHEIRFKFVGSAF
jgi:hypothetical protein